MSASPAKDAYFVLGYACNHRCSCCPCGSEQVQDARYPLEKLLADVERIHRMGVTDVTISGGEPTIHPDFLYVVEQFLRRGIAVHLLTNGDRFHDEAFADRFVALAHTGDVSVTTTFHSHIAAEHEAQNRVPGSFDRSLAGLRYLDRHGVNVAIKHCITAHNYRGLTAYLRFVTKQFSSNAEIQLWGIDLCGIDRATAQEMFVPFDRLKPCLEEALADFEQRNHAGQLLNINNLPLCCCDCYYWRYFSPPVPQGYLDYRREGSEQLRRNAGPLSAHCVGCPLRSQCPGTYTTVFDLLGDDVVLVPEPAASLTVTPLLYPSYGEHNQDLLFFSPYLHSALTLRGLTFTNRLTGEGLNLRLHADDLVTVMKLFTGGVTFEEAVRVMSAMPHVEDAPAVINAMLVRGCLE